YPRSRSRKDSNSSTRDEEWRSGANIAFYVTGVEVSLRGGRTRSLASRGMTTGTDSGLQVEWLLDDCIEPHCLAAGGDGSPGYLHRLHCVWKAQNEQRAAFWFVLAADLTVVLVHHSIHCAEAESRAFADGLRGVEGIENALRFADTGPRI